MVHVKTSHPLVECWLVREDSPLPCLATLCQPSLKEFSTRILHIPFTKSNCCLCSFQFFCGALGWTKHNLSAIWTMMRPDQGSSKVQEPPNLLTQSSSSFANLKPRCSWNLGSVAITQQHKWWAKPIEIRATAITWLPQGKHTLGWDRVKGFVTPVVNGAMAGRGRMLPICCVKKMERRQTQLRQLLSFNLNVFCLFGFRVGRLRRMFAKRFNLWK